MNQEVVDYQPILEECQKGRFPEGLRELYKHPVRQQIPWVIFPLWAQPQDWVEGGHEG